MNARSERLWFAIRLPDLPLSAFEPLHEQALPAAVVQDKRVIYASSGAMAAGVRPGMHATTAQVLSGCVIIERDEMREQQAIDRIADLLYQYSPYIERHSSGTSPQKGVLLEVSSCLQLFGGLVPLAEQLQSVMANAGHEYTIAIGHTAPCAWYLSFSEWTVTGNECRQLFIERLQELPITLIEDHPAAVNTLLKTGFGTFGDLATQIADKSIASFRKRLGAAFTDALCEIYNIDQNFSQVSLFEKPRDAYSPAEPFDSEVNFDYPVTAVDQLAPAIETLLVALSEYLRKRQLQCQVIEWTISDIRRSTITMPVRSETPQTAWQLFHDLSLIQFNAGALPFEVDTIKLHCGLISPALTGTHSLDFEPSSRRKTSGHRMTLAIAKLKARLGESRVYKVGYRDDRLPEQTNLILPLGEKAEGVLPEAHANALRPTWLLRAPEPLEIRGDRLYWHGYLTLQHGPERIIGDWWQLPVARDYYMAVRQDNVRVWIFHDMYNKQWYAHGVFS